LWCPNVTHTASARVPDATRIHTHLRNIAPQVKGLLVPGSTGEGWIMTDDEALNVLAVNLDAAKDLNMNILVGVLKTTVPEMLQCIDRVLELLRRRSGKADDIEAMIAQRVVGFTVCPPSGETLTQETIEAGLSTVLARGLPTALYQLPQVTKNEISPEVVHRLAGRFANFVMFKDTSGHDRVAQSGLDLGGVFLVRGAEGGYSRWPKSAGGVYDGFLLATANCFSPQLAGILGGSGGEGVSNQVEAIIHKMFAVVANHPAGNPFANANKALDHVMAYGEAALNHEPPLLFDGSRLPVEFVRQAMQLLRTEGLIPKLGYVV
jgi:dihydrodipicolinate synthase/N-acetylneuraminate lyase